MANQNTTITNGLVNTRFYQAYNDAIDSKQAMEPLAISQGVGPILGFNNLVFEPTNSPTSVRIRGFNSMYGNGYYDNIQGYMRNVDKYLELPKPKTHFLSVEDRNDSDHLSDQAAICNALILPSGRLYIEKPEIGTFPISYSSSPTERIYILVARENISFYQNNSSVSLIDYYWILRDSGYSAIFTDDWNSDKSLGDIATLKHHLTLANFSATKCLQTTGNSTSGLMNKSGAELSNLIKLDSDFIVGYYVNIGSNSFPTYNDYYGNTPMADTPDSFKLIPLVAYEGAFPITVKPRVYSELYPNLRTVATELYPNLHTVATYPVSTQPPTFDIDSEVPFYRLKLVNQDTSDVDYEGYENRVIEYSKDDTGGIYFMYEEE
jgi:hypothetical protein